MFIRKKKILNEIEAMKEDCQYWIEFFEAKGDSSKITAKKLECAKNELDHLAYFIKYNERYRELRKMELWK